MSARATQWGDDTERPDWWPTNPYQGNPLYYSYSVGWQRASATILEAWTSATACTLTEALAQLKRALHTHEHEGARDENASRRAS